MIRLDFETPFDVSSAKALAHSVSLDGMTAIVLSDYAKGSLRASFTDPKGACFQDTGGC